MAAKREKEETELKAPLCTPPQTIPAPPPPQPQLPISRSTDPKLSGGACDSRATSAATISPEKTDPTEESASSSLKKRPRDSGRCSGSGCRKRVGLIGFRCRCGEVFCSEHRYSDRHECGYDYKAAGREAIAKENPVVRAAKLLKV